MVKNLPAIWETWVRSLGQKIPWRRKWQPTSVFLPGESHGWRSLVGKSSCSPKSNFRGLHHLLDLEKAREFQKNIYFCFIDYAKAFDCVDHKKLWKSLKEMGIPHHFTCLLRNLYVGQEETVRTRHRTTDWFQIGKGVCQDCMLSPCLLNLHAECIMWNAGLDEAQTRI